MVVALGLLLPLAAMHAAPAARDPAGYAPCKVKQTVSAVFPRQLLAEGILRGEALIAIKVDHNGRLSDSLVVAYTHRSLAEAAMTAVRQWEFTPGFVGDQPISSRIDITFSFEASGIVVFERKSFEVFRGTFDDDRFAYRPYRSAELDEPIRALHQPGPIYPKEWIVEGRRGVVTIDFFIDETGSARLAAPAERGDEWLTAAALAALEEWKFAPPRRRGAPALVRARQIFVFEVKPGAS